MDIQDGDLVRLARDGDPAAFRLLVERHLPMARARAARLCPQPDDADDAVQDAFLRAFIALDRLRDPSRFAGWLGGILTNVCRAQRRRAPLTLLGDWPENLHPASAGSLPSAEDLDRADALSLAVAGLPPGQRQAVTLFYYADQPAGQIAWHARRRQGQPAQGPPPAARVHHRAPPRPYPRHLPEDPHDCRPYRARRPLAKTPTSRPCGARRRRQAPGAAGPAARPRRVLAPARPPRRRRTPRRRCRGDDRPAAARGRDHRDRRDRHRPGPGGDRHANRHRRARQDPAGHHPPGRRPGPGGRHRRAAGRRRPGDGPARRARHRPRPAQPVPQPPAATPTPGTRGSSRATWRSPTACTAGSSMVPSCAR